MKVFEMFDDESKFYPPGSKNVDADDRLKKKALEEDTNGGFEFGEFFIQLPRNDAEAEDMAHSLGAAGMDPYIEDALGHNNPDLFRDAALDLEMIMPNIENYLMDRLMDEKLINMFMSEMGDIHEWLKGGYKETLSFDSGRWAYADGDDDEHPEGKDRFRWGEPEPEDSDAYFHVTGEDVDEAWDEKTETPKSERGKYKDKTIGDLQKMKDKPGADKREINFAIRAKRAGGGKWKGVTAEQVEEAQVTPETVKEIWQKVFPHSKVFVSKAFGGGYAFKFKLGGEGEFSNNIPENDPLMYVAFLQPDGKWEETHTYMHVAPKEKHLAYSSEKFRKKSSKKVTAQQLEKRFNEVKTFVKQHAANLKNPPFDVAQKLGEAGFSKRIKRAAKGWGHLAPENTPQHILSQIKNMSDEELISLHKNTASKGSPQDFQMRAIARELKKRFGVTPGGELKEALDQSVLTAEQHNTISRLEKQGGGVYTRYSFTNDKGEQAVAGVNGKRHFIIYPDGKFDSGKNFKVLARGGWELQEPPKAAPKPKKKTIANTFNLEKMAQKIENAVGQTYPDGDPFDYLMQYSRSAEREGFDLIDVLDAAAKKHLGAKDYHSYLANFWDQHAADTGSDQPNPWRESIEEESDYVDDFTQVADMLYNQRPDLFTQHGDEYIVGVIDDVLKNGQYGDVNQIIAAIIHKLDNNLEDDDYIAEKAPPGMEKWIKDRKADFKKQYGDKWEEVLYATAWKQHNKDK